MTLYVKELYQDKFLWSGKWYYGKFYPPNKFRIGDSWYTVKHQLKLDL